MREGYLSLHYIPRLLCLASACYFLIFLLTAPVIELGAPVAIRIARRLSAQRAALLLLSLRLLPFGLAFSATLTLCVPSYFLLEEQGFAEPVGLVCLFAASLGLLLVALGATRAAFALLRSLAFARRCRQTGHETTPDGNHGPVWVLENSSPCLALVGLLRPQVVISRGILNALPEEELAVVLSHERAHQSNWDNLKRLCVFLTPGSKTLERAWIACAEYAADQRAARGDMRRSLALASALVRVARISVSVDLPPIATSFAALGSDLSDRVDRLLTQPLQDEPATGLFRYKVAVAMVPIAILFQPSTFRVVHSILERLVN